MKMNILKSFAFVALLSFGSVAMAQNPQAPAKPKQEQKSCCQDGKKDKKGKKAKDGKKADKKGCCSEKKSCCKK
ncbi:MAG: hypothetical protein HUK09_05875 [Bacteroidaceae bacterium]|nr:hypothetical protein [Bacteroidaceae bacterium]